MFVWVKAIIVVASLAGIVACLRSSVVEVSLSQALESCVRCRDVLSIEWS